LKLKVFGSVLFYSEKSVLLSGICIGPYLIFTNLYAAVRTKIFMCDCFLTDQTSSVIFH